MPACIEHRLTQRILAARDFKAVAESVAVGVGIVRVGGAEEFMQVVQTVAVGIQQGIGRIVRVQTVGDFPIVRHEVAITVVGRSHSHFNHVAQWQ